MSKEKNFIIRNSLIEIRYLPAVIVAGSFFLHLNPRPLESLDPYLIWHF
jgi:hypothetical protein